jgi:hypothetical protein
MPSQYGPTRPWAANSGALSGDQILPAAAYTELADNIYGDFPLVIATGDLVALSAAAILELTIPDVVAASPFAQTKYDATHDVILLPGSTTQFMEDALIVESGSRVEVPQDAILWTDAARAPQVISTLLWIVP